MFIYLKNAGTIVDVDSDLVKGLRCNLFLRYSNRWRQVLSFSWKDPAEECTRVPDNFGLTKLLIVSCTFYRAKKNYRIRTLALHR